MANRMTTYRKTTPAMKVRTESRVKCIRLKLLPREDYGTEDGDEDEDRGDFKRQQ
jgi:hypothetical protein